ncbi:hypothetical protein CBF87_05730 [Limosilactobacillus reuteri]|uniref:hypothetical protein n=1 Tax=Limosilactobacillus reuteri TaxID=1598 RepID=UPI000B990237|nr:hypothetical protein [Limosilactobacillus reuteri]OYS46628.1 hypothetical protein CBF87_05730 [Limosilactobacillus reuteri]OYS52191.1 hypothetical protein CBF81_07425 [Limosilactobacillus reuteri]
MKLKELEKPYKAETHLDHFTKAQDLITSAILSGWKIDFEAEPNEDYEASDEEEYPLLIKTYVWAPERWDEDYIDELHFLNWFYPQAAVELATHLKKVIRNYNCPYCSMLNGVGKTWKYGQLKGQDECIAFDTTERGYFLTDYNDFTDCTRTGRIQIFNCPFCGRSLNEEEEY